MKKFGIIAMALLLSFSVGCGKQDTNVTPAATVTPSETPAANNEEVQTQKFTEDDFKGLFKAYFSFNEQDLLVMNQNRPETDADYWKNFKVYQTQIKSKLGAYLAPNLKQALQKHYLYSEIDLPKIVSLNGYATYASAEVESVKINSVRDLGESQIYEIYVTTKNKVVPAIEFNQNYGWDEAAGYFVQGKGIDLNEYKDAEEQINAMKYIYAKNASKTDRDEIRLIQKYWVQVTSDDTLQVEKITEATPLNVDETNKNNVKDTQYIKRLPYNEETGSAQSKVINTFFEKLFSAPESTYVYYDKAYASNVKACNAFWETVGLSNEVTIDEDTYPYTFAMTINPYKDSVVALTLNKEQLKITPSVYSTKMQPRFIVDLPVQALLKNNEIVYYNYRYYVGTENSKIEFARFMSVEKISQSRYETGKDAETPEAGAVETQDPAAALPGATDAAGTVQ